MWETHTRGNLSVMLMALSTPRREQHITDETAKSYGFENSVDLIVAMIYLAEELGIETPKGNYEGREQRGQRRK